MRSSNGFYNDACGWLPSTEGAIHSNQRDNSLLVACVLSKLCLIDAKNWLQIYAPWQAKDRMRTWTESKFSVLKCQILLLNPFLGVRMGGV
jgi:hypothetical protein